MAGLTDTPLTDILAEAANAQFRAADFMGANVIRGVAPAKVNLFLGVDRKREDGLHEVVNAMHALAMHDVVFVNVHASDSPEAEAANAALAAEAAASERLALVGPKQQLLVRVDMVDKVGALGEMPGAGDYEGSVLACKDNLACRAAHALASALEREGAEYVHIRIEKQIFAQAGLGGGSSDAACVLACLARHWGVDDAALLARVAGSIGADVAFFLEGGAALYDGAGERFARALAPLRTPLVVVKPQTGVSTKAAYEAFDAHPAFAPDALLARVEAAQDADQVPLFNSLANAAESVQPELAHVREWLCAQPGVSADQVLMSGSGSAFFAQMATFADASAVAARALQAGYQARATSFSSLRAQAL